MSMAENLSTEERVTRIETTVESLADSVRTQWLRMNDQVEQLGGHIDALREAIQVRDRTPWANYLSAIALVVVIIGMAAQGYIRDLTRIQDLQSAGLTSLYEHTGDGHPRRVEEKMQLEMSEAASQMQYLHEWVHAHDQRAMDTLEQLRGRQSKHAGH
jgi:hypothetical protein